MSWSPVLIELLTRLGGALLLSLCLAVLMAWGWSQTDAASSEAQQSLSASTVLVTTVTSH